MNTQSVERIPRYFCGDTEADPLRHDLLFTFKDRTTRMFCKAGIHSLCFGVNVTEKDGIILFWLDVDTRVAKVSVSTRIGNCAVPKK